ncbi:MAG: carboxypeptidase-like regulatory domain-containing protein [Gemmatimonadetes bacterium]|nr:carboxypeptidase-like regulatory domain-containing protein [Gemmatimonadota bacterium]
MRRAGRVRISGLVGLIVLVGTPFALWAQTVTETDELIGTVLDAATGAPVANASVTAPQRGGVLTGADGRFRLDGVPAGLVVLHVEHIAYGRHDHPIEVDGEGTGLVLISVSPVAIELKPVLVDAESTWGLGGRSSPSSRNVIPRSVIAASASSGVSLGDFLGREVAGISASSASCT